MASLIVPPRRRPALFGRRRRRRVCRFVVGVAAVLGLVYLDHQQSFDLSSVVQAWSSHSSRPWVIIRGRPGLDPFLHNTRKRVLVWQQLDSTNPTPSSLSNVSPNTTTTTLSKKATRLRQQASEWQAQARELRVQARALETQLDNHLRSKTPPQNATSTTTRSATTLVQTVFAARPLTPEAIAQALHVERISSEQAHTLLKQLCHEFLALDPKLVPTTTSNTIFTARMEPTTTTTANGTTEQRVEAALLVARRIECLMAAAQQWDQTNPEERPPRWTNPPVAPSLQALQHQLLPQLHQQAPPQGQARPLRPTVLPPFNATTTTTTTTTTPVVFPNRNTTTTSTTSIESPAVLPPWLPSRLIPVLTTTTTTNHTATLLASEDVTTFQQHVLTETNFGCLSSDVTPRAALFRGRLKPRSGGEREGEGPSEQAYQTLYDDLTTSLHKHGLKDRIQFFLLRDPEPSGPYLDVLEPPVVLALSARATTPAAAASTTSGPRTSGVWSHGVAVLITLGTLIGYAVASYSLNPHIFASLVQQQHQVTRLLWSRRVAPLVGGLVGLHVVAEVVHWVVAHRCGLPLATPRPLPSIALGTFGCVTPLKSFPTRRHDLLDVALCGPLVTGVLSLTCLMVGLYKTVHVPTMATLCTFPFGSVAWLKSSLVIGTLVTWMAPKLLSLPLSQPIPLHPLVLIGYSGWISAALQLLPVCGVKGGRACDAVLGHRMGEFVSATTLLFLFSNSLSPGTKPFLSTWFVWILLLQRNPEVPCRNELTPVDRTRRLTWMAALVLSLLTLLPFPGYRRPALYNL